MLNDWAHSDKFHHLLHSLLQTPHRRWRSMIAGMKMFESQRLSQLRFTSVPLYFPSILIGSLGPLSTLNLGPS